MKLSKTLTTVLFIFFLINPVLFSKGGGRGGSAGKGGNSQSGRASQNNRSNQMNPNNSAYMKSRGYSGSEESSYKKQNLDNRSNQLNPNNEAYWKSRGYSDSDSESQINGLQEHSNESQALSDADKTVENSAENGNSELNNNESMEFLGDYLDILQDEPAAVDEMSTKEDGDETEKTAQSYDDQVEDTDTDVEEDTVTGND